MMEHSSSKSWYPAPSSDNERDLVAVWERRLESRGGALDVIRFLTSSLGHATLGNITPTIDFRRICLFSNALKSVRHKVEELFCGEDCDAAPIASAVDFIEQLSLSVREVLENFQSELIPVQAPGPIGPAELLTPIAQNESTDKIFGRIASLAIGSVDNPQASRETRSRLSKILRGSNADNGSLSPELFLGTTVSTFLKTIDDNATFLRSDESLQQFRTTATETVEGVSSMLGCSVRGLSRRHSSDQSLILLTLWSRGLISFDPRLKVWKSVVMDDGFMADLFETVAVPFELRPGEERKEAGLIAAYFERKNTDAIHCVNIPIPSLHIQSIDSD